MDDAVVRPVETSQNMGVGAAQCSRGDRQNFAVCRLHIERMPTMAPFLLFRHIVKAAGLSPRRVLAG